MAQSRKLMGAGQLDDAEKLAYEAKKLKNDFGWTHMGDTPDKLIGEIQMKKQSAKKTTLPPLSEPKPDLAKTTATGSGLPAPQNLLTSAPPAADRTVQANQLMAQARVELNKGNYNQAMAL